MISQPDDASLGSNSHLPLGSTQANYPLPLPDSDEELDAPLVEFDVVREEFLSGGFLWESDDDDEGVAASARSLGGRRRSSARLIEIGIESRAGSMFSERGDGMVRRGSSSAHRIQKEEDGGGSVVGDREGWKLLVEEADDDEKKEEGWW